jgi:uncharacterized membrane protein YhaH (DUF805 family)
MSDLFSMKGRYNRAKYFWIEFGIFVFWVILANVLEAVVAKLGGSFNTMPILFTFIISPAILAIMALQVVKRLHDIGRPGSHYWLLFIPLYNIYLGLVLLFQKGNEGGNQYGPDPLIG